jgi:uncharacterized protein YeaO (DUF488 family)
MIKTKHLMDPIDADDGLRVWVEPVGLTKDLQDWCSVDEVASVLGPPRDLWEWFTAHPREWEVFQGRYHQWLFRSPHGPNLEQLACTALRANFTLLHAGDDAECNCATALKEFITKLEAYCP